MNTLKSKTGTDLDVKSVVEDVSDGTRTISSSVAEFEVEGPVLMNADELISTHHARQANTLRNYAHMSQVQSRLFTLDQLGPVD